MHAAFVARERAFDGRFVAAAPLTGIYCRPSCPVHPSGSENIRFFVDNAQAEAAGFSPCEVCRPDDALRVAAAVALSVDLLKRSDTRIALAKLASECGYSASHFSRLFKRATGLTPAAYGRALREQRARDALGGGRRVTGAIYEAGYAAPSRFYADMKDKLGMTPSAWAKGGAGVRIHWAMAETSLGAMLVAATGRGVCRVSFDEGREHLVARFPKAELVEGGAEFSALLKQVIAAIEAPATAQYLDIPLDVQGTAFQERVWEQLRMIPPGETRSYGELAAALGQPGASRAVGGANGANPVAVIVPCHRVVAADGGLGGYAYGAEIKAELLRREQAD